MSIPDSGEIRAFHDRAEAGRMLAARLQTYTKQPDVVVCALPRGGVPVGAEIATALEVPLTLFIVRKLGVPGQEEVAMGALCSGGMRLINREMVNELNIPRYAIEATINREQKEVERRESLYARGHPVSELQGKTVILADDGIATGATITLAVHAIRQRGARKIVVAVPVAPHQIISQLRLIADEVICLLEPERFWAVGQWYESFPQLNDGEVCRIMDQTLSQLPESQAA